jgi:hypothetical protein
VHDLTVHEGMSVDDSNALALPCLGPETFGIVSLKGRVTDAKQKTNGRLWVPFKPGANKT